MDFCHLIVTCLFSMLRLPFDNQKVKGNYAIFKNKLKGFQRPPWGGTENNENTIIFPKKNGLCKNEIPIPSDDIGIFFRTSDILLYYLIIFIYIIYHLRKLFRKSFRKSFRRNQTSSPFSVAELLSVIFTVTKSPTRCVPLSKTTTRFCSVRPKSWSRERLETPSTNTS